MKYVDMVAGLRDAKQTMETADILANDFAEVLVGRLRKVSAYKLQRLKRELTNFNAHTVKWSEDK